MPSNKAYRLGASTLASHDVSYSTNHFREEPTMIDNYDLMSLICDAVAREQGMSTDIDDPEFLKLYDNISQPILALLNARDERSL
jgi:hypothetical protein